jgi:nitrogen fixation protein FixH
MAATEKPVRPLTGWHVLAMFVAFFGVIIAVNAAMAWKAISTFPGLEVTNGYIASQTFDAEMSAQKALNWTFTHVYDAERGELRLQFTDAAGAAVDLTALNVLVGRTTASGNDIRPDFALDAGVYTAPATLAQGKWMMKVEAQAADGTIFRQRIDLMVRR